MKVFVKGIGLLGPGLPDWAASRRILAGAEEYRTMPVALSAPLTLPAAERRRVGTPVKIALAVGAAACSDGEWDVSSLRTVFTSSGGDGDNLDYLCSTLASPAREISPTRFHNSVHNAAAGYWTIAARAHGASTSLCAHDGSFSAGLFEAAAQALASGAPVLLVAYDHPYPEPLHGKRTIAAAFGVALVLAPAASGASAALTVQVTDRAPPTAMPDAMLEALRTGVPAARALPLLALLATRRAATLSIEYLPHCALGVTVVPC